MGKFLKLGLVFVIGLSIFCINGGVLDKNDYVNPKLIKDILIVNEDNPIGKKFIPEKLVEPKIEFVNEITEEEKLLSKEIVKYVEELFQDAKKDGIEFLGSSAYRSYNSQKQIYKREVRANGKEYAEKFVAVPGESEHQTGLCIDVTNKDRYFVKGTKEADWLERNCHKYGFIIRYPEGKEDITSKSYEPWHIRYVGKSAAKEIYEKEICLEEYLGG